MLLGALLFGGAIFCLLVAVVPRPSHLRPARGALAFIRSSTLDQPPPPTDDLALLHSLLRRLTLHLGMRARGVTAQDLVEAGIDPEVLTPAEVTTLKLLAAAGAATTTLVLGSVTPGVVVLTPAAAWFAFVAPSVYISRRRGRRRTIILGELPDIVGLLRAFTNAQVPLEQALHLVSKQLAVGSIPTAGSPIPNTISPLRSLRAEGSRMPRTASVQHQLPPRTRSMMSAASLRPVART